MTGKGVPPSLAPEALFAKSKVYLRRGLAAKDRGELDEYQLWSSLALELVGKSALASLHPCLVADPTSPASLFAAAGRPVSTDVKTIAAHTLFERLSHVSRDFDKKTADFCRNMSLRRNAELHSGEAPFEATVSGAWEGRFWHAVETILAVRGQTIETWLGVDAARPPKELLAHFHAATAQAAKVRVETARERFQARSRKERQEAVDAAASLSGYQLSKTFKLVADEIWKAGCPACEGAGFLAGVRFGEEVSDEIDPEYPEEETVETQYVAEEFACPACGLRLDSREHIEAVGLDVDHVETEVRQREYEPEYGND